MEKNWNRLIILDCVTQSWFKLETKRTEKQTHYDLKSSSPLWIWFQYYHDWTLQIEKNLTTFQVFFNSYVSGWWDVVKGTISTSSKARGAETPDCSEASGC